MSNKKGYSFNFDFFRKRFIILSTFVISAFSIVARSCRSNASCARVQAARPKAV